MPNRPHRLTGIQCGNTDSIRSAAHIRATNAKLWPEDHCSSLHRSRLLPICHLYLDSIPHLHNGAHDALGRIHRKYAHLLCLGAGPKDRSNRHSTNMYNSYILHSCLPVIRDAACRSSGRNHRRFSRRTTPFPSSNSISQPVGDGSGGWTATKTGAEAVLFN